MSKFLSKEEAKNAEGFYEYENSVYKYIADDGFYHLIDSSTNLLDGKMALWCHYAGKNNYVYRSKDNFLHIIKEGISLSEDSSKKIAFHNDDGSWSYYDMNDSSLDDILLEELAKNNSKDQYVRLPS